MKSKSFIKLVIAAALVTVLVVYLQFNHIVLPRSAFFSQQHQQQQNQQCLTAANAINVVSPHRTAYVPGQETHCITSKLMNLTLPVCTYSAADDPSVSAEFQSGKYWDLGMVSVNLAMLRSLRSATSPSIDVRFLDIGANVGGYSLAAAHTGYQVTAVEANLLTVRHLSTSIILGNITNRFTLLHNAVSNVSGSVIQLGVWRNNRGHSFVLSTDNCRRNPTAPECKSDPALTNVATTIVLDDLLTLCPTIAGSRVVMKVDIEGSEVAAFDPHTSSHFMNQVDVVAIHMEWVYMTLGRITTPSTEGLLQYLRSLGYTARNVDLQLSDIKSVDWRQWPEDVIFVKQDAEFLLRRTSQSKSIG